MAISFLFLYNFICALALRWTSYQTCRLPGTNSELTRASAMYRSHHRWCRPAGADTTRWSRIQMTVLPRTQLLNRRRVASPSLPSGSPAASDHHGLLKGGVPGKKMQSGMENSCTGGQEFTCSFSLEFSSISCILYLITQVKLSGNRIIWLNML